MPHNLSHFSFQFPPCKERHYNSTLSLWLSVDPMSDKYPGLSPYTYCANNPVRLVDPDGRKIWVGNYYYRNGNLYDKNDKVFIPDQDSFEGKALQSLNVLYGTEQGYALLNPLIDNDGKNVYIKNASERKDKQGMSGWGNDMVQLQSGEVIEGTIYWNPDGVGVLTTAGFTANATTDLGHEFSHAFDDFFGYVYVIDQYEELSTMEWMAVYRENLIRRELGAPYREYYGYIEEPNYWYPSIRDRVPKGPYMLKDGKPYFPEEYLKKQ